MKRVLLLAILSLPAFAANPATVCASANNGSSITTMNCTGTVTAGATEVIFAAGVFNSGDGVSNLALTDSLGNTIWAMGPFFTPALGCISPASNGICAVVFLVPKVVNAGSDTFTVSWTTGASFDQINVVEVTGANTADPYDGLGFGVSSGATSVSVTANGHSSNANDTAVMFCAQNTNQATAASGFTGLDTSQVWITAYKTGVAGNVTGGCTYSSSNGVAVMVTLRPSGSAYSDITIRQAESLGVINDGTCTVMIVPTPGGTFGYTAAQINGNGATYTLTKPSNGGAWTALPLPVHPSDCFDSPYNSQCGAAYLASMAVNTGKVQWSISPTDNGSCGFIEAINIAPVSPVDVLGVPNSSTAAMYTSNSIDTTNAKDLVIGFAASNVFSGSGALTLDAPWVTQATSCGVGGCVAFGTRIFSSTQMGVTVSGTLTGTGSTEQAVWGFKYGLGSSFVANQSVIMVQ